MYCILVIALTGYCNCFSLLKSQQTLGNNDSENLRTKEETARAEGRGISSQSIIENDHQWKQTLCIAFAMSTLLGSLKMMGEGCLAV